METIQAELQDRVSAWLRRRLQLERALFFVAKILL